MSITIGFYSIAYIFHATFQSIFLSILSIYSPSWTTYYFTWLPITHGFIVVQKVVVVYLKLNLADDVRFI
jgi:hypothetical protein